MKQLCLLLALVATPTVMPTQDSQGEIYRAGLEYIKTENLKNSIKILSIDPRVLPSGSGPIIRTSATHGQAVLTGMLTAGVSTPLTLERAQFCGEDPRVCNSGGGFAMVTFASPTTRGDTAVVQVLIQSVRDLTAADSAKARTNRNPADPAFWLGRMGRPVGQKLDLHMARTGGTWKVTKSVFVGGS